MLAVQPASLGQITLSADRQAFRIQFSGYFPALVELVKSLAGRRYAADEKVWHVPAQPQSAAAVQRLVDEHGLRCADEVREFARLTLCNGWAGLGGELRRVLITAVKENTYYASGFNRTDGAKVWTIDLPEQPVISRLALDRDGRVLVSLCDGSIICLGE